MRAQLHRLMFLAVILTTGPALAGPGVWTSGGPEGGTIYDLAVHPSQPDTIFLGALTGIYKSTDTGATWIPLNPAPYSAILRSLRVSPHDSQLLMVSSDSQLLRSTDGGDNWTPLDGGLPLPTSFSDIAFDPVVPGRVWAVAWPTAVWQSLDNGDTWTALAGTGLPQAPYNIKADPHVAGRLLGTVGTDLYRSTDGGASWTPATGLPGTYQLREAFTFTGTPGTVLVGSGREVYRSVDAGASFTPVGPIDLPLSGAIRVIQPHPANPDVWWLAVRAGLVRTDDGGASYSIVGAGIRPVAGGTYDNGVSALYVRPDDVGTIYAGADYTGFYVTHDGGTTWLRRNTGIQHAPIRALAVHPTQPLWVYAGYGDAFDTPSDGLFRSVDRGDSWFSASPTLEASGLRSLLIDPNTTSSPFTTTMYAAGYGQPLISLSGNIRDGNAGIFKSTDGGATWSTIDNGIPFDTDLGYRRSHFIIARTVVADPTSGGPPGGTGPLQTLYLSGSGSISYDYNTGAPTVLAARIYKSTDAGANWTASDTGLPIPLFDTSTQTVFSVIAVPLVIDPVTPTTLYVGTSTGSYVPGYPYPLVSQGVLNGVFKSTDGGATWVHSSNGLPRLNPADPDSAQRSVLALALAPSLPSRLYAATHNLLGDSVIFRSDDAGASWYEANNGIAPQSDIRALIVDPTDPDIAYAGSTGSETNPGGVYRTTDGGQTWTSYSIGLPPSAASALELDLSGAVPRLYAGTRHGVFSIDQVPDEDADGVPSTIESGAPSGGDGNGDGIPDTVQAQVASLLDAGDGAGRGGDRYITIEVEPLQGACARLENAHALPASAFPVDTGHDYPLGLVRLDLGNCTQARLRLHYHGAGFGAGWRFRVFAPLTPEATHTYAWRDLPFTRDGNTWTVILTDNQLGDLRATENAMLFQGGVALSESIFANGFEP